MIPIRSNSKTRPLVPALLLFSFAAFPNYFLADIIYLKNGRKIVVEASREDAKQVFYESAAGEIAIPRSLVDHIEKSAAPHPPTGAPPAESPSPGGRAASDLPIPAPPAPELPTDAASQVIKDNAIDKAQLQRLDDEALRDPSAENRHLLSQGYHQAAIFLTRQGDPESAIELYRHALKFAPDDLSLALALAYLLVKQTHYNEAVELLRPAEIHYPKSPDVPLLLGSAYYRLEDLDRAIEEWKRALALEDDPRLREALAKAEKERQATSSAQALRSEHFLVRYSGGDAKDLGDQVLKALESDFTAIESDLDVYPQETIVVILYLDQDFRDITRSPSWVGAINDGKIRVPVSGLTSMTFDLARVLKHELTHSFVRQVTLGRCPVWFNEGLAQLEDGSTTASLGAKLARALTGGGLPPYSALESSFLALPADQVSLTYAKSLAALEYVRDAYGQAEIRRMLKQMASNPHFDSLLENELRANYASFEQAVANDVELRYGS